MKRSREGLTNPRGYIEGPAVVVDGTSLLALSVFLRRREAEWRETVSRFAVSGDLGTATLLDRVTRAAEVLTEAAAARAGVPFSEGETVPVGETGASSRLTTDETAVVLSVTPRRVRQLLADGALLGSRVAGRWSIDRASVEKRKASA